MSKATENTSAVVTKQTRAAQVLQMMINGKPVMKIAEELGIPEQNVRKIVTDERLKLNAAMQEMQEHWMGLTLARTEWLLSKVLEVIDKQTEGESLTGPDKNLLKTALEIMKFQKEVVIPDKVDRTGPDVVLNQTFVGGSMMYQEAMKEMQYRKKEDVRIDKEPPMQITATPDMVRLEELAAKWLPEGVFEDEQQSGDDE